MNNLEKQNILIYDIETATDGVPNPEKDTLKVFGMYSYLYKRYMCLTSIKDIKKVIEQHDVFVGFNNFHYDNTVLSKYEDLKPLFQKNNFGDSTIKYKVNIDLRDVFKKRAVAMKIKDGMLGDLLMEYSLDYISKVIGIVDENQGKIKDFDYSLLNKDKWTKQEKELIRKYTLRDIEVTKKMYEWVEEYFSGFKAFLNDKDVRLKSYLTSTTGSFAYKAICHKLGIEETYSDSGEKVSFGGGYVAYPTGGSFHGNILLFDFSSLYPNLFIMGNLFGNECDCCEHHEKWHGDKLLKVEGYYCRKKLNKLGELLKTLYLRRVELKKKKDKGEYTIKILINTMYGIVSNPTFEKIHNYVAGRDCTSLGRQFILYARKRFREEGYKNLMSDTDSIAVMIPDGKTKEDAQSLADKIVEELLAHMPFPW